MEDWLQIIVGGLGTLFMVIIGYLVAWFQHKQKQLDKDNLIKQKDIEIADLKNGWKKRVENWVERQEKQICKECYHKKGTK